MKKLRSVFFLCLLTIGSYSQKKTEKYIVPDVLLQVDCGFGRTDEIITDYANYGYTRNYKAIRENVNSKDLYLQLLSAICLMELAAREKIVLTDPEKEFLSNMKSSEKLYAICHDDVSSNGSPIRELFNNKTHLNLIRNRLGFYTEE